MPLIVGLGNPGKDYERTRHNVGFLIVDEITRQLGWSFSVDRQVNALVAEGNIDGHKVILVKPQTFMNLSGQAVASLVANYNISPTNVWITYDDAALELGALRIRKSGSAGGHNGMKSIITALGTEVFPRFRVGVGPQPELVPLEDFVLSRLSADEQKVLNGAAAKTATIILDSLKKGIVETTQ